MSTLLTLDPEIQTALQPALPAYEDTEAFLLRNVPDPRTTQPTMANLKERTASKHGNSRFPPIHSAAGLKKMQAALTAEELEHLRWSEHWKDGASSEGNQTQGGDADFADYGRYLTAFPRQTHKLWGRLHAEHSTCGEMVHLIQLGDDMKDVRLPATRSLCRRGFFLADGAQGFRYWPLEAQHLMCGKAVTFVAPLGLDHGVDVEVFANTLHGIVQHVPFSIDLFAETDRKRLTRMTMEKMHEEKGITVKLQSPKLKVVNNGHTMVAVTTCSVFLADGKLHHPKTFTFEVTLSDADAKCNVPALPRMFKKPEQIWLGDGYGFSKKKQKSLVNMANYLQSRFCWHEVQPAELELWIRRKENSCKGLPNPPFMTAASVH